ncbi:MAG: FecR family protein [Betaproteobacteria bacterium]|nr:FecR family protein [Aquincola sp.]MDH5222029.1 FecR family protein [Betaproteobacteria bacterium]
MRNGLVFLGLVIGAAGSGQALAQTAGVVQFVAGEVKVVALGGHERQARKGVPVNVGDTLVTPAGGLAQLKMGDGAIVVVQPESRLTVAEFHYAGVEDGNEKVRYRLEHGGFRAVTGAIGRTHKKNYLIETPIAHMGVRGTDHESYYFPATGPVSGDGVKPGAFNKVNTGMTFLRTPAGEVDIAPNQVGYVGGANQVPVILPTVPGFFNRSIAPLQARPAGDSRPEPVQAAEVKQDVKAADGESVVRARGKPMMAGSGNGELYGFSVKQGMDDDAATFGRSGNGMMLVANGAEFKNEVRDYMGAGVNWGTWQGGPPSVNGQMTAGGVHFISTTNPTDLSKLPPALMTASYSHMGGPAPTNNLGEAGSIKALNVNVDFTNQQITNYHLQAVARGAWDVQGSGSISAFTGATGIGLSGTCSSCSGGSQGQASGTAHGGFVGAAAEGVITTFGVTSAGKSLSGAAYLTRPLP